VNVLAAGGFAAEIRRLWPPAGVMNWCRCHIAEKLPVDEVGQATFEAVQRFTVTFAGSSFVGKRRRKHFG